MKANRSLPRSNAAGYTGPNDYGLHEGTMKPYVITYSRGEAKIDLTRRQVTMLEEAGVWIRDSRGYYKTETYAAHQRRGDDAWLLPRTFKDTEIVRLIAGDDVDSYCAR